MITEILLGIIVLILFDIAYTLHMLDSTVYRASQTKD